MIFVQKPIGSAVLGASAEMEASGWNGKAWTRKNIMSFTKVGKMEQLTHGRPQVKKSLGTLEMCAENFQMHLRSNEALRGFSQRITRKYNAVNSEE